MEYWIIPGWDYTRNVGFKRNLSLLGVAALLVGAQGPYGTVPKPTAADYPAHAALGEARLGAEYLVRTVFCRDQSIAVRDYLVVEVALYPPPGKLLTLSADHFTLRLNGKKLVLHPQPPGFVAASLRYPDWEQRPTLVVEGGAGNAGVIIGRPQQTERFPDDNRPARTRLPAPPRAPTPQDPSGLEKETPASPEEAVVETALPEAETKGPVSGYLYFAYKGKPKSIRTLELIYNGPAGNASLSLAP